MFNFLHTLNPKPIMADFGFITIYWYGFFIVLGISAALLITLFLAKYYKIKKDTIIDLSFYLIIGSIIGARIYDVLLELPYYLEHPANIIKIWQGGLAIHGAIIGGLIIVYLFTRKNKLNFLKLTALIVPGLALGQAIGRWGNYFNQELFGQATNLPWGIPIDFMNRPNDYISANFFHPTFLYESLGCLLIFILLILISFYFIKREKFSNNNFLKIITTYLISYSVLRFSLEFIKIDTTPLFLGMRWPQVISLVIILLSIISLITFKKYAKNFPSPLREKNNQE